MNKTQITTVRKHTKSRTGCRQCKARKVKCDEKRPLCLNCARHFEGLSSCGFQPTGRRSGAAPPVIAVKLPTCSKTHHTPNPLSPLVNVRPTGIKGDFSSHQTELRLLHHFSTLTHDGLPHLSIGERQKMWSEIVPQLAFGSSQVFNGLMAFSALHLRHLAPTPEPGLADLELRYLGKAITCAKEAASMVGKTNPDALFIASLFLFHYIWLTENQAAVIEPYNIPTRPYHFGRSLIDLCTTLLDHGLTLPCGHLYLTRTDLIKVRRPSPSNFIESCLLDLEHLSNAISNCQAETEDDLEALRETLLRLWEAVNTFSVPMPFPIAQNLLGALLIRSPTRFMELVDEHNPFAMAIIARNFALIHVVDPVWWLHGWDGMDLAAKNIRGIINLMPKEYLWVMSWPLSVIEGSITLDLERQSNAAAPSVQLLTTISSDIYFKTFSTSTRCKRKQKSDSQSKRAEGLHTG